MDSPAPDAELMELVAAGESEGVLQDAILVCSHQQLVPTHCTEGDIKSMINLMTGTKGKRVPGL